MNTNHKFPLALVVALLAILLNSFTTQAFAEPITEPARAPASVPHTSCEDWVSRIDIVARRSDYAAMDRILAECTAVAGLNISIPITGRALTSFERFMALKDRQSELLDRSGAVVTTSGYNDSRFMKLKDRQAEERMP